MLRGSIRRAVITAGLELSNLTQNLGLLSRARGRGVIFTLHHVRPYEHRGTNTIRHLEITPDFLDAAILAMRAANYAFVRLEDVPDRLDRADDGQRFAAFTLDDGFVDNAVHAAPVFARHGVPFTIFVCKGFSERSHTLWWETLDRVVNSGAEIRFDCGLGEQLFPLATPKQRCRAAAAIGTAISTGDEVEAIARLDRLALSRGIDPLALTRELVMDREALMALGDQQPLLTLGAHTVSHRALACLKTEDVLAEMGESSEYASSLGDRHAGVFAFPYGDVRSVSPSTIAAAERMGFSLAVTTSPGTLCVNQPRAALPRVSLNGFFQKARYAAALASGVPFQLRMR